MSVFKFKRFQVQVFDQVFQIGTDALLLGAFIKVPQNTNQLLEVGSGSAVVSLMLAQRTSSLSFNLIDVNPQAVKCSKANIEAAKFDQHSFLVQHCKFQDYLPTQKVDLIYSNPPFFDTQVNKDQPSYRVLARNNQYLPLSEFMFKSTEILSSSGSIYLILPFAQCFLAIKTALNQLLFLKQKIIIKAKGRAVRVILEFTKHQETPIINTIEIQTKSSIHTKAYKELLKDYLLA